MAGCLGNGRLRQQWQTTSVQVECPSPTELHHPEFSCACRETLNLECFQLQLFFVCLFLWGWDLPSLITWIPASEPLFFFKGEQLLTLSQVFQ